MRKHTEQKSTRIFVAKGHVVSRIFRRAIIHCVIAAPRCFVLAFVVVFSYILDL